MMNLIEGQSNLLSTVTRCGRGDRQVWYTAIKIIDYLLLQVVLFRKVFFLRPGHFILGLLLALTLKLLFRYRIWYEGNIKKKEVKECT
jgi:hypothetical protein